MTKGKLTYYGLNLYVLCSMPYYTIIYAFLGLVEDIIFVIPAFKSNAKGSESMIRRVGNFVLSLKLFLSRVILLEFTLYLTHGFLHTNRFGQNTPLTLEIGYNQS
jgi:hypothetical protein